MNLREFARGKCCMLRLPGCAPGPGNEKVVLAHIRRGGIAGTGGKPSDFAAIPMCYHCHQIFDGAVKSIHSRSQLDADALRGLCQWLASLDKSGYITTCKGSRP